MKTGEYHLTIITVCRNALPALNATIDSVLRQKRRETVSIEHLIIDGASADGTPASLAQLLEEKKIEAYISEPDNGIYDAMNKGIRLARGEVLYFLNAGDLLTNEGLAENIQPILNGDFSTVAAPILHSSDSQQKPDPPVLEYIYLGAPVCHQGYFAKASLYRDLGGYDAETYRCMADADFISKAYAATGMPYISNKPAAIFEDGGFSENCGYHFLPEYFEIRNRHWEKVQKHSAADADYAELITFALLEHCHYLIKWIPEYGLTNSKIELHCKHVYQQRKTTRNIKQKLLLWWAENVCLKQLKTCGKVSPMVEKLTKWAAIAGSLRADNPFMNMKYYPHRSLKKALYALVCSRCQIKGYKNHAKHRAER